jgi:hypothetical protein
MYMQEEALQSSGPLCALCTRQHSFKSASLCSRVNSQKARGRKSLCALLSADLEHKNLLRLGAQAARGRREHHLPPSYTCLLSQRSGARARCYICAASSILCKTARSNKSYHFLRERKNPIGRKESKLPALPANANTLEWKLARSNCVHLQLQVNFNKKILLWKSKQKSFHIWTKVGRWTFCSRMHDIWIV